MKRYLFALTLAVPMAGSAQQTQPMERTVTVNANATVEREPEQAVILLAVESPAATAQLAARTNATKMDALVAALRRLGISGPNVRTVSYQLQPQYSNERPQPTERQGPPRIVGYRAINMVQVTVDTVTRTGAVIDAAIAAGANRVAGLSFELKDPQLARNDALRLAVTRARGEAQAMAEAAGQRLGEPLTISTGGYAVPRYARAMDMVSMEAAQAAPTPIEPGTLSVQANVTIVYKLENR
ncbi:MAG: SIMPL domain-containing protein [Gemmatimonadota bacterium]